MTYCDKMLKCIKQTVKGTAIKYQYNLWRIQVLKKYYKRPSSSPTGCEKKKKDMKKTKTLRRKGPEVYWNEEELVLDLRKDNPSNFAIMYRYYRKDNKDISRIKKWLEHQKG